MCDIICCICILVYSLCDDGFVEAEECRRDIISYKIWFIICWIKYCLVSLLHKTRITPNLDTSNLTDHIKDTRTQK